MRVLKLAIISFIILFIVVTSIGLLFPASIRVSRATDIHAPADSVFLYMSDMKYWKFWMNGADTGTITFLTQKTSGAGTVARFGNYEVSEISVTKDSIVTIWKGEKGSSQSAVFNIIPRDANSVTVNWYFTSVANWYPWERFSSMMNDKIMGPPMESSLSVLKKRLEE
ncbi:MAG: hypothetical protein ABIY35_03560 [Chitinophagaceae bacterium]